MSVIQGEPGLGRLVEVENTNKAKPSHPDTLWTVIAITPDGEEVNLTLTPVMMRKSLYLSVKEEEDIPRRSIIRGFLDKLLG
jgi:hypothetical protein